jgi:hypothetical protein
MGVGGQRHAPAALPPEKTRCPLYRRLGAESLASAGIRSPDRPARSESLYRLSYPGSIQKYVIDYSVVGPVWQEPEPSQATGMALARCILGKFLGVVCHCFTMLLDVPTFAGRCLHVRNNASAPSSERWNCG